MNAAAIKQTILNAVQKLPVSDTDLDNIPLPVRLLLKGRHPMELVAGLIAQMPDEYMPHVVQLAHEIVGAAGGVSSHTPDL